MADPMVAGGDAEGLTPLSTCHHLVWRWTHRRVLREPG